MKDKAKTKAQLLLELEEMRQRLADLEAAEFERLRAELERDAALLALQESEERFRTVADFTSDWEYWIGPDGKYLYVSPSCEWITGYRPEAFQRDPQLLESITHPEDRGLVVKHFEEVLDTRAGAYVEFRILTRGGNECWVEHFCQPVYSADGRYLGQRASNRDITARVRAQKVLQESIRLSQSVFDTIPEAIIVSDLDLRVTSCNRSVQRILGYSPEELIGKTYVDLMPEETLSEFKQEERQAQLFEKGYLEQDEFHFRRQNGEVFPASFSVALLKDADAQIVGIVGAIRDMTDLKLAEEALHRQSYQQQQLLETARHLTASLDVKEVLTGIASGAKGILDAYGCTVYLLEADGHTLTPVVALESPYEDEILSTPLHVESSFTGQAVKAGCALVFNDAAADDIGQQIPGTPVEKDERIIVAPFVVEGNVLGAMCLNRIGTYFSAEELRLAEAFATYASTVLRNAQTHDALQREVEERTRAEAASRMERDRAQGYLDIAGVMLLALNTDGEITLMNRKGHAILGYEEGELVGRNWFDICLPPRARESTKTVFNRLLAGETEPVEYYENAIRTKSGEERIIAWHNTVLIDEEGAVAGTLSSGEDITERIWAEEKVRRRNREMVLLNRVIMAASSSLDVTNVLQVTCEELALAFGLPQTVAALLNAEGTEATVVAEYRLPARPSRIGETVPVERNPAMVHVITHQMPLAVTDVEMDDQLTEVRELLRQSGARSLLIVPIPVARGRIAGAIRLEATEPRIFSSEEVSLAHNVAAAAGQALETARLYEALRRNVEKLEGTVARRTAELQVALERARDADRVKSVFVSNVSHELRTPLASLKLYLGLLTRGRPEKREAYLETARRETDRLQNLIEALLDISRLDLGKAQANLQPTDLNLLVSTLISDREALVADRGLSLDVELAEALPVALADPKLIEQVLTNLLTNAVNYTPVGGQITLCTAVGESDGQKWVTATVSDTGPGISQEERGHLFERFYRGSAGRASSAPGTGLGLAICKEILDLHGGRITLQSKVGRGSRFTLWLRGT